MSKINASRREFLRTASALSGSIGAAGVPFALNLATLGAAAAQTAATDYKALVCLFMFGGNDTISTVLATDGAEVSETSAPAGSSWAAYWNARYQPPDPIAIHAPGVAPVPTSTRVLDRLGGAVPIVPITAQSAPLGGTRTFALHPALGPAPVGAPTIAGLKGLFDGNGTAGSRRVAIIANAGPLIVPLADKTAYASSANPKPSKLFSHNDQQSTWQSLGPEGARAGWGGRIGDLLASAYNGTNTVFTAISTSGNAVFLTGQSTLQYQVGPNGATLITGIRPQATTLFGSSTAPDALKGIITADNVNLFAKEHAAVVRRSIDAGAAFQAAYTVSTLATVPTQYYNPTAQQLQTNSLATQLQTVARVMKAQAALGVRRQIFFVSMGGFDTHDYQNNTQSDLLARISHAVDYFDKAMVELGLRDNVVLFTASDFGRTGSSNGDGTDHGWGAHHFVYGAVKGGDIYGTFPPSGLSHPLQVGNGSLLPQIAVDQIGATLASWFGVTSASDIDLIFPNLKNFPTTNLGFTA